MTDGKRRELSLAEDMLQIMKKATAHPAHNSDDIVYELPARVRYLGEALKPVAKNLHLAIAQKVQPSGHEFLIVDDLLLHSGVIHQALTHLSGSLEYLMGNVVRNESAGMSEACRAAGRLEQVISEFIVGYHQVKASRGGPDTREARQLLLGVYRHHMQEISVWLDEIVKAIADPGSALKMQGMNQTTEATLTVTLTMTRPPEMDKLNELAIKLQLAAEPMAEALPTYEQAEPPRAGILGTIGALAFGFGISNAVFGRLHD